MDLKLMIGLGFAGSGIIVMIMFTQFGNIIGITSP